MSRIGRLPVVVPAGVTVEVKENNYVVVKGSKGTLERNHRQGQCRRRRDQERQDRCCQRTERRDAESHRCSAHEHQVRP